MKGIDKMFEIMSNFLAELIASMPYLIAIYILFDFIGSFFFGKK